MEKYGPIHSFRRLCVVSEWQGFFAVQVSSLIALFARSIVLMFFYSIQLVYLCFFIPFPVSAMVNIIVIEGNRIKMHCNQTNINELENQIGFKCSHWFFDWISPDFIFIRKICFGFPFIAIHVDVTF